MTESHHGNVTRVTRKPGSFAPVPQISIYPVPERPLVYVVEWDIPSNSAAHRARFYRALRRLRRIYEADYENASTENRNTCDKDIQKRSGTSRFSTMSVLITEDPELAGAIFNLAKAFGRAHIYEARQLE